MNATIAPTTSTKPCACCGLPLAVLDGKVQGFHVDYPERDFCDQFCAKEFQTRTGTRLYNWVLKMAVL